MQSGEPITIKGREYRLDSVLSTGVGSYGQVWAATDPIGRSVALKFINTEAMSQADPSLHGHWRAHLEREILFLDRLSAAQSRHIVALLAHGQVDGQPVLVLERLQANLSQWLSQLRRDDGPPPNLAHILDWIDQILEGLDVIHQAGFVYRDLKFSNILVGEQGALLKLADFGSLKREDGDSTRSCIGTPATMAPEQIVPVCATERGCEYAVDFRADYYALGLLLFALLTEQSSTAAQRRLGQLLALHGQEGATKYRDQLGGLTDEEQDLLRRAIEFWTVPICPEQEQHGAARLLSDLLTRLLARDPAARPASSMEIRQVLDAVRADQPALPLISTDGLAPPPDRPPNRSRRLHPPVRPFWSKQTVGLLGAAGLAGALAWATAISPLFQQEPSATPRAARAPVPQTATALAIGAESTPSPDASVGLAISTPQPARSSQSEPAVTERAPNPSTAGTDSKLTAQPQTPAETATEPVVANAEAPSSTAVETTTEPATAQPVAESASQSEPVVNSESETTAVVTAPHPSKAPGSHRGKSAAPSLRSSSASVASASRKVNTAIVTKRSKPSRAAKNPSGDKAIKPASAIVKNVEKNERTPARPEASKASGSLTPFVVKNPAPKAAPIAKSTPKPPEPAPVVAAEPPASLEKVATTPRINKTITKERSSAKIKTVSRTASSSRIPPALPPIELVSNTSRSRSETVSSASNKPPIELIGRSNGTPTRAANRAALSSAPVIAAATPPQNSVAIASKTTGRSSDPVAVFQKDANRAAGEVRHKAENFGNWASRASSSVGTEIQRSLNNANQAITGFIGNCNPANGCQTNPRLERRDRWARTSQGTAPRAP